MKLNIFKKKDKNNDPTIEIRKTSWVDDQCNIGKYTYIGDFCIITKAEIGRYNSIGDRVTIGPSDHDYKKISTSHHLFTGKSWYDEIKQKPCIIENDVWIGVNAVIMRGVKVSTGAVVGANSFVNKDVPPYAIVAGTPAKIIKYRFEPEIQEKILASKWWEHDADEAKAIVAKLENIK